MPLQYHIYLYLPVINGLSPRRIMMAIFSFEQPSHSLSLYDIPLQSLATTGTSPFRSFSHRTLSVSLLREHKRGPDQDQDQRITRRLRFWGVC